MSQLPPKILFPRPENDGDRAIQDSIFRAWDKLKDLLNGGLRFSDNHDMQEVEYTTNGSADTEDTVAHNLKRVPNGFLLVNSDKAVVMYDSGTTWTDTNIYLKANVTSASVKIKIF